MCLSERKPTPTPHLHPPPRSGLEYTDKAGVTHPAIPRWTFTAADGVEMPLEEGTSAFITMNPGYIGARWDRGAPAPARSSRAPRRLPALFPRLAALLARKHRAVCCRA